jgi:Domain of unknown function (DUF4365)
MTNDDTLLSDDDVESALSIAYVQAIAAQAGYTCGEPPGPDRDSIDVQIAAGGAMRPKIDLQLKASIRLSGADETFSYPLGVKNYNDLRVETQTPRLLLVLDLPRKRDEWLYVSINKLIIRRAAYWISLRGKPETTNSASVTIFIPKANIFDVEALSRLMDQSRQGRIA